MREIYSGFYEEVKKMKNETVNNLIDLGKTVAIAVTGFTVYSAVTHWLMDHAFGGIN